MCLSRPTRFNGRARGWFLMELNNMCVRRSIGIDTVRKTIIIRTVELAGRLNVMGKSHLKLVTPNTENRTVAMPRRKTNAELRTREYLTDAEVESLTEAAKGNRYGQRDATMILMAYRHG